MAQDRQNLGRLGEDLAVTCLKDKNYRIIERNFRIGRLGEIDIIAEKIERKWLILAEKTIVFVEVKTICVGSKNIDFSPEAHVNKQKIDRLKRLGMAYLSQKYGRFDIPWQIDVIGVDINSLSGDVLNIRHHENVAF